MLKFCYVLFLFLFSYLTVCLLFCLNKCNMYSEFCHHAVVLTHCFVLKYYWKVRQSVRHHIHHLNVVYEIDNKVSVGSNFYSCRPVRSLFYKTP
jgi:hypothetical protein